MRNTFLVSQISEFLSSISPSAFLLGIVNGNGGTGETGGNGSKSVSMLLQADNDWTRMQTWVKIIPKSKHFLFCCGQLFCMHVCVCVCVWCVFTVINPLSNFPLPQVYLGFFIVWQFTCSVIPPIKDPQRQLASEDTFQTGVNIYSSKWIVGKK